MGLWDGIKRLARSQRDYFAEMRDEARERRERPSRDMYHFLMAHRHALARRRMQLVQIDAYGNTITKKWDKEKRHFIYTMLVPYLKDLGHIPRDVSPLDRKARKQQEEIWFVEFDRFVEEYARWPQPTANLSEVATGDDYERFCADLLTRNGWTTQLTQATGDQGVDIIAMRGEFRAVFQCKFYTSPVGNKAVQEAVAGRLHERAAVAVVITNASYTPSAEELARTTGTVLIHHDDIPRLMDIIASRRVTP
jgi:restriction system protein